MIMLEDFNEFVNIGIPGYFWHTQENVLYSIKSGRLRKIKGSYWRNAGGRPEKTRELRYSVSHKNKRYTYSADFLQKRFGVKKNREVEFILKE